MTRVSASASNRAPKALSYLYREAPTERDHCFACGRYGPLVPGHIVCESDHGRMGPCQRYVNGRYCGFQQERRR